MPESSQDRLEKLGSLSSEPATALPEARRNSGSVEQIVGLDVGDRRIGVALTDKLGITAQPLLTIYRATLQADLRSICRLIRRHAVSQVVIGLPLHSSGKMSVQAAKTMAFGAALKDMSPSIELQWIDERFTTAEAHSLLGQGRARPLTNRNAKNDRKQRLAIVDQVAAVLILEAFLSLRTPALLPSLDD